MRSLSLLVLTLLGAISAIAQDGLFVDFVTSKGDFTCQLDFENAPRTVANFVGLATGGQAWLDLNTGAVKRVPFYDGLTFHRVVSGFVIQGGSPKGDGTDGPGYFFRDEFDPSLRHDAAGVMAMANSGPNTNGSQFYITLDAASSLDDSYSVFGHVVSGLDVVQTIGTVAVDSNDKPTTPVTMQSVTIRRVGAAAIAFDVGAQGLPVVGGAGPRLVMSGATQALRFERTGGNAFLLFHGGDLSTWTRVDLGYCPDTLTDDYDVTSLAGTDGRHFFRVAQVNYPGASTPGSLAGRTVHFTLLYNNGPFATLTLTPDSAGLGGLVDEGYSTGSITSLKWTPDAYAATMICYSDNFYPFLAEMAFDTPTSGRVSGQFLYNGYLYNMTGSFTLE